MDGFDGAQVHAASGERIQQAVVVLLLARDEPIQLVQVFAYHAAVLLVREAEELRGEGEFQRGAAAVASGTIGAAAVSVAQQSVQAFA